MAFTINPFPEFSWSFSRNNTFTNCERNYYYDYYGSHNGWLYQSSDMVKLTFRLKKMLTLPLAVGQVVHNLIYKTIKHYYESGKLYSVEELVQRAKALLNEFYLNSTKNIKNWYNRPTKNLIYQEMYYFKELDKAKLKKYNELLPVYFSNFFKSHSFKALRQKENELKQLEDFCSMRIQDIKVYVVLDLLYHNKETGIWTITDWKTGKPSDTDITQLTFYAKYIHDTFNVPYENIRLNIEYLLTNEVKELHVDTQILENNYYLFQQSSLHMQAKMADMLNNEPLDIEYFEKSPSNRKCGSCNYLEICKPFDNED